MPSRNFGTMNNSAMIATALTEIRTDQLPNMGIECYHYASPLSIYLSRENFAFQNEARIILFVFKDCNITISYLGFEVHLAVTMKGDFWDVTPRSLVDVTDVSEEHNASIFRVE
jgi:hypothetical protein